MKVRRAASTALCAAIVLAFGGQALMAQVPPGGNGPPQYQPNQVPQQNVAPVMPVTPPAPPFVLSPQEQAQLDQALAAWEQKSSQVKAFKCNFDHLKYDPTFAPPGDPTGPLYVSKGEMKYGAPDKGMFHEIDVETWQVNANTHRTEKVKLAHGEHWACDGKSIYQVDHEKGVVNETRLPPEMQGQAITEGPLPFAFGAQASKLKARYYMRLTTPADQVQTQVWLQILPRWRQDAANFFKVEVILRATDMLPSAIKISTVQTQNGPYCDVYVFKEKGFFDLPNIWGDDFAPSPFGFKHVVQPIQGPPGPSPASNGQPGGFVQPGGNSQPNNLPQARRPLPANMPGYR